MSTAKHSGQLVSDQNRGDRQDAPPSTSYDLVYDDPTLPSYTEHDASLRDRVQQLVEEAHNDGGELPIVKYPDGPQVFDQQYKVFVPYRRRRLIVKMYFDAIRSKKDEVVALLIESGLVTTETTNEDESTPLLAAVGAENVRTVQQLMDFDADVNALGVMVDRPKNQHYGKAPAKMYRTPLQSAAEKGNLTIVKLLMETYQADDSIITPDGQHALRLAATNGHKEIVKYLPARRGGGWRRWKTKHHQAMRRVKRATKSIFKFFQVLLWYMPKFFLWDIPKHSIVLPTIRGAKWLKNHHQEVPGIIARWLKKIPKKVWEVVKEIPVTVKEILKDIWKLIKRTPKAARIVLMWLWGGLKKFGNAIQHIFARFFSLLHTIFAAIVSFFRHLTFQDVLDGFKIFLHAIFVDTPKKLWEWLCKFGVISYDVFKALFGTLGCILWLLARAIVEVFIHVPKKLAIILVAIVQSMGSGCKEVMIWVNPKRT